LPSITEHFAHVLLFACLQCERALASARASSKQNLEEADAHFFNPHCDCGWTGMVVGMEAVKHWVEPWRGFTAEVGAAGPGDGTCDGRAHSRIARDEEQAFFRSGRAASYNVHL